MNKSVQKLPALTLLIPTIGRINYLEDIIKSINIQTRSDFEVLILNNACEDSVVGKFKSWAANDDRVKILTSTKRLTAFENFNRGIFAAQAAVIGFCHDDDYIGSEYVESHLSHYQNNPNVGFIGSNHAFVDNDGKINNKSYLIKKNGYWKGKSYISKLMSSQYNPIIMQGISFRKSAFTNGFDVDISPHYGDFVILMRIAEYWDVGYLSKPLIFVRRHDLQASSSMSYLNGENSRRIILTEYCREYSDRWPSENFKIVCMEWRLKITLIGSFTRGWFYANDEIAAGDCVQSLIRSGVLGYVTAMLLVSLNFFGVTFKLRALFVEIIRKQLKRMRRPT